MSETSAANPPSQAVLVVGMHRSGTSMLARLLNLVGVEIGSDLLPPAPDNETGFWEHREIQFIHDRIHESLEHDWVQVSRLGRNWWERPQVQAQREALLRILQRDFAHLPLWGLKDPRLCSLLPLWRPLLAEINARPAIALIFRNPAEVVRSLGKRNALTPSRCHLLWLRSVLDAERDSRGLNRTLATYERLLDDWQGELARLGRDLGIDWPVAPEQIASQAGEFVRPGLRHHQVSSSDVLADENVPELVRRAYSSILAAATTGRVDDLSAPFDEIEMEIDCDSARVWHFVADLEGECRSSKIAHNVDLLRFHAEASAAHGQLTAAQGQVAAAQGAASLAEQAASARAAEVEQTRAELARIIQETAEQRQTLEQAISQQQVEIQDVRGQLGATREKVLQAEKLLEKTREESEAQAGRLADATGRISQLQGETAALRDQLHKAYVTRDTLGVALRQLFKSFSWKLGAPMRLLRRVRVGIKELVPLTDASFGPNGGWEGKGLPQFLIPIVPSRGWMRLRTKLNSSVNSRAVVYLDTGVGFSEAERIDVALVAADTVIHQLFCLRETTYYLRFDPIQHRGECSVEEFSLESVSRLNLFLSGILNSISQLLFGGGDHRPSIWIALKLLVTGKWLVFYRQLVKNVAQTSETTEYDQWRSRHGVTPELRDKMRREVAQWKNPPVISVVLPVYDVPERYLRRCIESVTSQSYPRWELCIADDASTKTHIKKLLRSYEGKDPRIKIVYRQENGNISAASNSALKLATGEFVALLDHDDELAEHALFRVAQAILRDPSLDMIYSDEDKLSADGKHFDPFFKPDWSPEYFLACMYTCHLGVYRTELIRKVGGWRSEYDGAQDYDLVLRIVAQSPKIHHIPDVLYHWRTLATSTASGPDAKPLAHIRARQAIAGYLDLIGRKGRVEEGPSTGFHRIRYEIRSSPKVSIVIPSACREIELHGRRTWFVLECVSSIRRLSTYANLEIIVLDNNDISEELAGALKPFDIRLVSFTEPFNLARKMNLGGSFAQGEHLILLNDDIEVISPDWVESMLEYSQWPEIGAVGAQLLFPNGTQQHVGVTLLHGDPGHPFYQFPGDHPGYYFSSQVHRNWSAVTGACMMTRADVFKSVGGFSEEFPLNYNDVDYCLKVRQTGKRIVYMPYARLYHHESVSKTGTYAHEVEAFKKAWTPNGFLDPYYNPNLTMQACDFKIGIATPVLE